MVETKVTRPKTHAAFRDPEVDRLIVHPVLEAGRMGGLCPYVGKKNDATTIRLLDSLDDPVTKLGRRSTNAEYGSQ